MNPPTFRVTWPHGWQEAAERVRVRLLSGNRHGVWIAPDGRVWIRNQDRFIKSQLPESWRVGVFGPSAPQDVIEDAVIYRMREISEMGVAA